MTTPLDLNYYRRRHPWNADILELCAEVERLRKIEAVAQTVWDTAGQNATYLGDLGHALKGYGQKYTPQAAAPKDKAMSDKLYCLSHDISQDFPVQIEELDSTQTWCDGFKFMDDGTLKAMLNVAATNYHNQCKLIEALAMTKKAED